jgi:hypothetical protein
MPQKTRVHPHAANRSSARRHRHRKKFKLDELLAQWDALPEDSKQKMQQEMREWDEMGCVGRERFWEPQPEPHVCLRAKLALRAKFPRRRAV